MEIGRTYRWPLRIPGAWVMKDPQLWAQLLLCNYFVTAIAAFYKHLILQGQKNGSYTQKPGLIHSRGKTFQGVKFKRINEEWMRIGKLGRPGGAARMGHRCCCSPHTWSTNASRFTPSMEEHRRPRPPPVNDREGTSSPYHKWQGKGFLWTGKLDPDWKLSPSTSERQYGRLPKIGLSADHPGPYGMGALIQLLEHSAELSRGSTSAWSCPTLHRAMFYNASLACWPGHATTLLLPSVLLLLMQ